MRLDKYINYAGDLVTHGVGLDKRKPTFVNLSLTNSCNARCVMCDIWRYKSDDLDADSLIGLAAHPYLADLRQFGITGGEPFLRKDIGHIILGVTATLPRISFVGITTNGFMTSRIRRVLPIILGKLRNDIVLQIAVSVDGVGDVHDRSRGVPNVYSKVSATVDELVKIRGKNSNLKLMIACTITKENASNENLLELDAYAESKNIEIIYRLGVEVDRIYNKALIATSGIVAQSNDSEEIANFLAYKIKKDKSNFRNIYYEMILGYLQGRVLNRTLSCKEKRDGIMMDSNGDVYVCSVSGKKIGNLVKDSVTHLIGESKEARAYVRQSNCSSCFHDHMSHYPLVGVLKNMVSVTKDV